MTVLKAPRNGRFLTVLIFLTLLISVFLLESGVVNVAASPTDWSMFHQNLTHTGLTSDAVTPPLNVGWSYPTGAPVESSPAVSGTVVYVGSNDGNVYAFAPTSAQVARPVGGYVVPVNKLAIFAPYLALFGLVATVAIVVTKPWKRPDN